MSTNNTVLLANIKESLHEVIDPLKQSINKAIGSYETLDNRVKETEKKVLQLFDFHNKGSEESKKKELSTLELKKDLEALEKDVNGIGKKIDENKIHDDKLEERLDGMEKRLDNAETSYNTLKLIILFF